jgi:hypothetical protein
MADEPQDFVQALQESFKKTQEENMKAALMIVEAQNDAANASREQARESARLRVAEELKIRRYEEILRTLREISDKVEIVMRDTILTKTTLIDQRDESQDIRQILSLKLDFLLSMVRFIIPLALESKDTRRELETLIEFGKSIGMKELNLSNFNFNAGGDLSTGDVAGGDMSKTEITENVFGQIDSIKKELEKPKPRQSWVQSKLDTMLKMAPDMADVAMASLAGPAAAAGMILKKVGERIAIEPVSTNEKTTGNE